MKKIVSCLMGAVLFIGHINALTLEVPEKVKGLLLKTGASW